MKEITLELGGRTYQVAALPIGRSKVWREALAIPFSDLAKVLTSAADLEINSIKDIASVVQDMSGVLLGSVDMMLDLLFSYAPILKADREWIEENAYDEEALRAFAEVLKLAFPFGVLLGVVTGRMETKTSLNSLLPNGASPLPASGPKRKEKK